MRARYIISVFTGTIIFGSLAYANYQMDSTPLVVQDPHMLKTPHISDAAMNLAQMSEEYPTRSITDTPAETSYRLAKLNLFSSQSQRNQQAQQQQNNNQPITNNNAQGRAANTNTQQQQTTNTQTTTQSKKQEPGYITNRPQESDTRSDDTTTKQQQTNQVSETYIPANSQNIPVAIPDSDETDIAPHQPKQQQRVTRARNSGSQYYQTPRQRAENNTEQASGYEHRSFQSVPTPVYFAPGSVYNQSLDTSISDDAADTPEGNSQDDTKKELDRLKAQAADEAKTERSGN